MIEENMKKLTKLDDFVSAKDTRTIEE